MKIYGIEITQAQIDACIDRMKRTQFTHFELDCFAQKQGVPSIGARDSEWVSHRFADRLIQRERRAGNIEQPSHARWSWRGPL